MVMSGKWLLRELETFCSQWGVSVGDGARGDDDAHSGHVGMRDTISSFPIGRL